MREIKFRAWDKNKKEMLDSEYIYLNWDIADLDRVGLVVMQFTGLKDKNGVEIYEGDIVRYFTFTNGKQYLSKNEFPKQVAWNSSTRRCGWNVSSGKRLEVIGNIYQNSKLLKINKGKNEK